MSNALDTDFGDQVENAFHIDLRRCEQDVEDLVFEAVVIAVEVVRMQIVAEQLSHERVAVGVDTAGSNADERVPRLDIFAVDDLLFIDDTDRFNSQVFPEGIIGVCEDSNLKALELFRKYNKTEDDRFCFCCERRGLGRSSCF